MSKNFKRRRRITLLAGVLILVAASLLIYFNLHNRTSDTSDNNELQASIETGNDDDSSKENSTAENRFENVAVTNDDIGVPVLYYHSVLPDSEVTTPNEVTISPEKLREELQMVKDLGYTTITLGELNNYLDNNLAIPEKSLIITFDDGYTDNYVHAFPILKELNMKATIFMIASEVDTGYYLSKDQLKEMSDYGIDIGSHTDHHVHLNTLSYDEQLKELKDSKEKLESILGKEVISIAYPFGDYDENSKKAATAAGYSLAFTTNKGLDKRTNNKVELNRIYVSSAYSLDTFKQRLINTK